MDINRPLDDYIKESVRAKRAKRSDDGPKSNPVPRKRKQTQPLSVAPRSSTKEVVSHEPASNSLNRKGKSEIIVRPVQRGITKKRHMRGRGAFRGQNNGGRERRSAFRGGSERGRVGAGGPSGHRARSGAEKKDAGSSQEKGEYAPPKDLCVAVTVSNLHVGVTQADITELFETVGPLKESVLHKDMDGRSLGEARVTFESMRDALCAIKKYNLVPLDNQPLQISLVARHTHNEMHGSPKEGGQDQTWKTHSRQTARSRSASPPQRHALSVRSPSDDGRDDSAERRHEGGEGGGHGQNGRRGSK